MAEVIVALDAPPEQSRRLLDRLPDVRWVKVGPILYTREGPALIRDLVGRGVRVFLDLKWHDIPNTVAGPWKQQPSSASPWRPSMRSVGRDDASGGQRCGQRDGAGGRYGAHSFDRESRAVTTGRPDVILLEEVTRLARITNGRPAGIVCSPLD